ncbi:MAG: glycosyltransferase [Planctomycetota bacterium]|nr:glycosyltransferase [Planctomycetota bacterium]
MKIAVLIGLLMLVVVVWLTSAEYSDALHVLRSRFLGQVLTWVACAMLLANLLALIWRVVLVFRYNPAAPCSNRELPVCTVVVPAYNEGEQVLKTLRSIAVSDYPKGKLRVIVVNDGSTDDTWQWIRCAVDEFPHVIFALNQTMNCGKRRALYAGFLHAVGEILVTIDSDSQVEPHTIRNLVSPLVRDRKVGAVAGNIRILNRADGPIPRMLYYAFAYSFEFIRASQSEVNTVMCTPGALSAYRRNLVTEVLPRWLNQRFCGQIANIGEDRAMTNLILCEGYHVHFQRNAVAYTKVPSRYRDLCKMFLRWSRSNIRETLVMTGFAFRKFRVSSSLGTRLNLILHWMSLTLGQVMKLVVLGYLLWKPEVFVPRAMFGAAITASIPAVFCAIRYRSSKVLWMYVYGFFWLVGLLWIGLYAWVTPHRTGWLTRGSDSTKPTGAPELNVATPKVHCPGYISE